MHVQIKSIDILKAGSRGVPLAVGGVMRAQVTQGQDGGKILMLETGDNECIGGDESGFPPARKVIERDAVVYLDKLELCRIIELALADGLLDLNNSLALQLIEHLAKSVSNRLTAASEDS